MCYTPLEHLSQRKRAHIAKRYKSICYKAHKERKGNKQKKDYMEINDMTKDRYFKISCVAILRIESMSILHPLHVFMR